MDPYLELHWLDVHTALCTYARDALQPLLGTNFVARLNERIVIETRGARPHGYYPDVHVMHDPTARESGVAVATKKRTTLPEPIVVEIESEPFRQPFIEIHERTGNLVTVIEFVSPTNKATGNGRKQYRQKQLEHYEAGINLVEIDLTRQGTRRVLAINVQVPKSTYLATVFRAHRPRQLAMYSISLNEKLPILPIPLRKQDPEVKLPLQELVDRAYENGAYGKTLDYTAPIDPPFKKQETAFVNDLLKPAGKR
jgi:hypothetical protein